MSVSRFASAHLPAFCRRALSFSACGNDEIDGQDRRSQCNGDEGDNDGDGDGGGDGGGGGVDVRVWEGGPVPPPPPPLLLPKVAPATVFVVTVAPRDALGDCALRIATAVATFTFTVAAAGEGGAFTVGGVRRTSQGARQRFSCDWRQCAMRHALEQ